MGINTFGRIFMPKNKIFYELFEEVASTVQDMGHLIRQVVYEPERSRRSALISQLEDMEHRNDDTTHRIFTELVATSLLLLIGKIFTPSPRPWMIYVTLFSALPKK